MMNINEYKKPAPITIKITRIKIISISERYKNPKIFYLGCQATEFYAAEHSISKALVP
jgi:hypothetical protein